MRMSKGEYNQMLETGYTIGQRVIDSLHKKAGIESTCGGTYKHVEQGTAPVGKMNYLTRKEWVQMVILHPRYEGMVDKLIKRKKAKIDRRTRKVVRT